MAIQIIKANPEFDKEINLEHSVQLEIAEFFYDTIQGEGIHLGQPAAFLRLQHCTQNCIFCDTQEVWRFGNPYSIEELFILMDQYDIIEKLRHGQHLILTGGSPVRQQYSLISFITKFISIYGFKPYIEIENECTLMPTFKFVDLIDCWNNSPKLKNSGNPDFIRYQPRIIEYLSHLNNSWFKFVVSNINDWYEIQQSFLDTGLIKQEQVILMPLGANREELHAHREFVVELAIQNNVRYCTREHIVIWNKKTGI